MGIFSEHLFGKYQDEIVSTKPNKRKYCKGCKLKNKIEKIKSRIMLENGDDVLLDLMEIIESEA